MELAILQNTYKGKKVFLTGHTGFKGSWLLSWLHSLGAVVKGFALSPEPYDLYNQIEGDKLCQSIIGDIRSKDFLIRNILDFQPDFIFHLAAQPLVRSSYEQPLETFDTNIIGTANLLEGVRFLEKPCSVILITTDKVYENKEWFYPYRETDRLGGHDPYSASKACAELVISSYQKSFFNPQCWQIHQKGIAVARAGNVIGGGDWSKDRIIPDIVRALSEEKPITIRSPYAIRPWQHVLEPLSGYLLLGSRLSINPLDFSESFNFGPNIEDSLKVIDLVKIAIDTWGKGSYNIINQDNELHEAGLLRLDISKSINKLGWKPIWNSKEAIQKTINEYIYSANIKSMMFDEIQNFYK